MGHLLIIQNARPQQATEIASHALRVYSSIHGVTPSDRLESGETLVYKFPKRYGTTARIVRDRNTRSWIAGVGVWFHRQSSGETALGTILEQWLSRSEDPGRTFDAVDGTFALALGDGRTEECWLVTDRIGSLHMFTARVGQTAAFATSSLVLGVVSQSDWDRRSVGEFVATGTIFEDRSLFAAVRKLPPGNASSYIRGRRKESGTYWSVAKATATIRNRGTVRGLAAALEGSVGTVFGACERPVVDLTGGLDSRALIGALLSSGRTFETVVNGRADDPDVVSAGQVARVFGLKHRNQQLPADWIRKWWPRAEESFALCDGEHDVLEYARVLEFQSRLARHFTISVNGSGGEFCKGYWWELLFPFVGWRRRFSARRVAAARFVTDPHSSALLAPELSVDLVGQFTEAIQRAIGDLEDYPNTTMMDNVYLMLRMQRWQGRLASATNRLWSCTSPFMFRSPLELALSAPPPARIRNRMSRRLIEHFDPELAKIPLAQGYPALPVRISNAHLFLPLAMEVGRKVLRKARLVSVRPAQNSPKDPSAAYLLEQEPLKDLLAPDRMLTRDFYSERRLQGASLSTIGRVVTLEMVARKIHGSHVL